MASKARGSSNTWAGTVFFDRDGVLNEKRALGVRSPEQLRLLPGAGASLAALQRAGLALVIVTNKPGIAMHLFTERTLAKIHDRLQELIEPEGARVDAFYFCPHGWWASCDCRKPKAGLLRRAVDELHLPPGNRWMVGDTCDDIVAGAAVGAKGILIGRDQECSSDAIRVSSLPEATRVILQEQGGAQ